MYERKLNKIALGGGCHWGTKAVFQTLTGVVKVVQGYVASIDENSSFLRHLSYNLIRYKQKTKVYWSLVKTQKQRLKEIMSECPVYKTIASKVVFNTSHYKWLNKKNICHFKVKSV